jgi:hypothetical protein
MPVVVGCRTLIVTGPVFGEQVSDKPAVWKNRITLVAIKGRNQTILSSPVTETSPEIDRPEKPIFLEHGLDYGLKSRLGKFLPGRTKKLLEKIIR